MTRLVVLYVHRGYNYAIKTASTTVGGIRETASRGLYNSPRVVQSATCPVRQLTSHEPRCPIRELAIRELAYPRVVQLPVKTGSVNNLEANRDALGAETTEARSVCCRCKMVQPEAISTNWNFGPFSKFWGQLEATGMPFPCRRACRRPENKDYMKTNTRYKPQVVTRPHVKWYVNGWLKQKRN